MFDKPSGLLSVPGIGPEKADCLASRATAAYPGARIVHRLDRDTSGIIVLAKDDEAQRQLSVQFQERQVQKVYEAVVWGVVEADEGEVDLPIRKDLDDPPRQMVDFEHGRASQTPWRVIKRGVDRTRVEMRPRTGRSHQLRIHMRELGHPILGDDLYANAEGRAMADRLLLHARELEISHPTTAEPMRFEAAMPF